MAAFSSSFTTIAKDTAWEKEKSKGGLINHSKDDANLSMKVFVVNDAPRVVFLASKDISVGDEIQYDYGEKRKEVLRKNPWLKWNVQRSKAWGLGWLDVAMQNVLTNMALIWDLRIRKLSGFLNEKFASLALPCFNLRPFTIYYHILITNRIIKRLVVALD